MKKALFSLLLLPAMIAAQGLQLISVSPNVLCPGDSIFFTVKIVNGNNTQITIAGPSAAQSWQYNVSFIKTWPHSVQAGDTLYTLRTKSASNLGIGVLTIYTYPNGATSTSTMAAQCTPTGIMEYQDAEVPVKYFDLNGRPTSIKSGAILIEQRGNTRRKIFVLD